MNFMNFFFTYTCVERDCCEGKVTVNEHRLIRGPISPSGTMTGHHNTGFSGTLYDSPVLLGFPRQSVPLFLEDAHRYSHNIINYTFTVSQVLVFKLLN